MDIRLANNSEEAQIKQLWQSCFNDVQKYVDWLFDTVYKPENTVVIVEDGRVLSAAQMLPYNLSIRGEKVRVSYIVGVSTLPEERSKGLAARVMLEVKAVSRRRGYVFAMLYPAIHNYYEKFGFVPVAYYAECTAPPHVDELKRFIGGFRRAGMDDIPLLNRIYERYMSGMGAYLHKDSVLWKNILEDFELAGGGAYIIQGIDARPCGYLLYTIRGQEIRITEAAYTTNEGMQGVFAFIKSHNIQVKSAILRLPLRDKDIASQSSNNYQAAIAAVDTGENVNVRLGAMVQTVDRARAEGLYKSLFGHLDKDLKVVDDAGFTRLFFDAAGSDSQIFINLVGWN